MRGFGRLACIAVVVTSAATASAEEGSGRGIELGIRAGYSLPLGSVLGSATSTVASTSGGSTTVSTVSTASTDMSDIYSGRIPLMVDAGFRATPNIYVGASFMYGVMLINGDKTGCNLSGADCSAHEIDFGVDAHYHLAPEQTIDPWVGLGIGYEWVTNSSSSSGSSGGGTGSATLSGWQFVNFQLGADYKAQDSLGIGPFVSLSLGEYSSVSGDGASIDIPNKALHEWFTIGLRGAYDIPLH
jgi:outer membrane protein W